MCVKRTQNNDAEREALTRLSKVRGDVQQRGSPLVSVVLDLLLGAEHWPEAVQALRLPHDADHVGDGGVAGAEDEVVPAERNLLTSLTRHHKRYVLNSTLNILQFYIFLRCSSPTH